MLIELAIATCLGLAPDCEPIRDHKGRIARSRAAIADFKRAQPCPATGKTYGSCPGWRIDHVVPLKRCGLDLPANMQWLTIEQWREKTRWE